jgi:diacylglycerol kinase family enzyme
VKLDPERSLEEFVKLLLIVNPTATSVNSRRLIAIAKLLSAEHQVIIRETGARGDAFRLARAAADHAELVVVFGGDGTLNEAANGLAATPDLALAVLPGGSTNIFARVLGFSAPPIMAAQALLASLRQRLFKRIGVGSANGRYFLCNAGMGFDADVVRRVERSPRIRRIAGTGLFAYAALRTWLRRESRSGPRFRLRFADGSTVSDGYFTICQNLHPYTFIGFRPLTIGDAEQSRGLSALTLRDLHFRHLASGVLSSLGRGSYLRGRTWVDYRTNFPGVEISGHRPFPYQLDGDYLGETDNLSIIKRPEALTVVIPVSAQLAPVPGT